ncbi:hypothetical protein SAMN05216420_101144 [Nitrosospira sp. Nl5]|nr:hypothetical protein SAMN05216420_101144 [Nitrosospira sp. Nl5]
MGEAPDGRRAVQPLRIAAEVMQHLPMSNPADGRLPDVFILGPSGLLSYQKITQRTV